MFIALRFIALVASFSIIANLIMLATEKATRGRHPEVDGRAQRRHRAHLLRRGAVHRPPRPGDRHHAGASPSCRLLERYGLPLPAEVYYIEKLPVVMRASEIAAVGLAALALCCLATVYPAMLASRMRPVERPPVRVESPSWPTVRTPATRPRQPGVSPFGPRGLSAHGVVDTFGGADYFGAPHDDRPDCVPRAAVAVGVAGARSERPGSDQDVRTTAAG